MVKVIVANPLILRLRYWRVPVSSTDKVFDGWIKDLGFNLYLHQKSIDVLVWW